MQNVSTYTFNSYNNIHACDICKYMRCTYALLIFCSENYDIILIANNKYHNCVQIKKKFNENLDFIKCIWLWLLYYLQNMNRRAWAWVFLHIFETISIHVVLGTKFKESFVSVYSFWGKLCIEHQWTFTRKIVSSWRKYSHK